MVGGGVPRPRGLDHLSCARVIIDDLCTRKERTGTTVINYARAGASLIDCTVGLTTCTITRAQGLVLLTVL